MKRVAVILALPGFVSVAAAGQSAVAGEPAAHRPALLRPDPFQQPITVAVHFEFGNADLTNEARNRLSDTANRAQGFTLSRVVANGYTDAVGPDRVNQPLSDARALSHAILVSTA